VTVQPEIQTASQTVSGSRSNTEIEYKTDHGSDLTIKPVEPLSLDNENGRRYDIKRMCHNTFKMIRSFRIKNWWGKNKRAFKRKRKPAKVWFRLSVVLLHMADPTQEKGKALGLIPSPANPSVTSCHPSPVTSSGQGRSIEEELSSVVHDQSEPAHLDKTRDPVTRPLVPVSDNQHEHLMSIKDSQTAESARGLERLEPALISAEFRMSKHESATSQELERLSSSLPSFKSTEAHNGKKPLNVSDVQVWNPDRTDRVVHKAHARMLLDTGSETTNLMREEIKKEIGAHLTPCSREIYWGDSKEKVKILGEVAVKWHFLNADRTDYTRSDRARSYRTKFLVIPDSGRYDLLLSNELIQRYDLLRTNEDVYIVDGDD
jgi:hypothetical protein